MKRIISLLIAIFCVLALCSCDQPSSETATGDSAGVSSKAEKDSDKPVEEYKTPYAVLKLPADFKGKVNNEVKSNKPYTLSFKAEKDGTELFSLVFNGKGDTLLGTIEGEKENTVVYVNLAKLSEKNKNYETYCAYQEELGVITYHLKQDYEFTENAVVEFEDKSTYDIKTSVVTLKYPAKWKDKVTVKEEDEVVSFSCDGVKLFDICFAEKSDAISFGKIKGTPVSVITYKLKDEVKSKDKLAEMRSMQDDVNVIYEHLQQEDGFSK